MDYEDAVSGNCQPVDLKEMGIEAIEALARVDAEALERLLSRCKDLLDETRSAESALAGGPVLFSGLLEITRGNIHLLRRLCDVEASRFEYASSGTK